MAALLGLIEVDQVGIHLLCPTARRLEDLAGEHRERHGDRKVRRLFSGRERREDGSEVLPIQPRRRGGGIRQPVQRDVVDNPLGCQATRDVAFEKRARDLLVAVFIVVEHPRRQPDGRIGQRVADRLRMLGHLDEVAPPEEGGQRIECHGFLLLGVCRERGNHQPLEKTGRQKSTKERRPDFERERAEEVEVNAGEASWRETCELVSDVRADVTALSDIARVAEPLHQFRPGARHAARVPAEFSGLTREAEAR